MMREGRLWHHRRLISNYGSKPGDDGCGRAENKDTFGKEEEGLEG